MKTSQLAIYSGLFILLTSFGKEEISFIPAWLSFTTGSIILCYGIFKEFKIDNQLNFKFPDLKFNWLKLPSKVYILIGIVLVRLNKLVETIDNNIELQIFCLIIGALIIIYGLILHFDEKKQKKNSGNIED